VPDILSDLHCFFGSSFSGLSRDRPGPELLNIQGVPHLASSRVSSLNFEHLFLDLGQFFHVPLEQEHVFVSRWSLEEEGE
jgi:hypothetical protein